jgi:BarA-like signal transduction histidine kinase
VVATRTDAFASAAQLISTPRSMLDFFIAEVSCVSYDDLVLGVPLSYNRSKEVEEWAIATAHSVMTMIVLGAIPPPTLAQGRLLTLPALPPPS